MPSVAHHVTDCPRCGVKEVTFDLKSTVDVGRTVGENCESYSVCRRCGRGTIFNFSIYGLKQNPFAQAAFFAGVSSGSEVSHYMEIRGFVGLQDHSAIPTPEYIPDDVASIFMEGALCLKIKCWNAAGTMFRLCIDIVSRSLPPEGGPVPISDKTKANLHHRLSWLFENRIIPDDIRDLSHCIRQDGNDAAHGGTLNEIDANDLADFTTAFLERIYTTPKRVEMAKRRRESRRGR
jgi:hypothetical protein